MRHTNSVVVVVVVVLVVSKLLNILKTSLATLRERVVVVIFTIFTAVSV